MSEAPLPENTERISLIPAGPQSRGARLKKTVVAVAPAGAGFLADAYDIFAINIVLTILNAITDMSSTWKAVILMSTSFGTIVGQLGFGALSDRLGRKIIFMSTAVIISITAFVQMFAPPFSNSEVTTGTLAFLSVFRFLLGIGIGGEYPLSSTTTSESATNPDTRGSRIAAVFSMQGIGAFLATLVGYVLLVIDLPPSWTWRLLIGIGVIPSVVAFFLRLHHFREDKQEYVKNFAPISFRDITWAQWKLLAGTSLNWFLLDIVFYGNALFSSSLIAGWLGDDKLDSSGSDPDKDLAQSAMYTFLLTCSALPGYWFSIWAIDHRWFGRWRLQLGGFIALTIIYGVIAIWYDDLLQDQFALPFFLYALTYFFINAGPNTTTYVIPAEVFPARLRATFHGISAASGKAGALIGAYGIAELSDKYPKWVFGSCTIISALGVLTTIFFTIESRGMKLDTGVAENRSKGQIPHS